MKSRCLLAIVVIAVLTTSQLNAAIVLNGSFEQPQVDSVTQFMNGETIGAGWTVDSGNTAFIILNSAGQGPAWDGAQFLEIHADSVSQMVTNLSIGTTYSVSFYATATSNDNFFGTGTITTTIADQTDIFSYTLNGDNAYGSAAQPWTQRKLQFVATDTSARLSFSATGGANDQPLGAIDNVAITAVPEPSSLVLTSLVSAMGVLSLRKRGK